MSDLIAPDLEAAGAAVQLAQGVIEGAIAAAKAAGGVDENQVVAYDLAHAASAVAIARSSLTYGEKGPIEALLACAFVADALRDLGQRFLGREALFGTTPAWMAPSAAFVTRFADPSLPGQPGWRSGTLPPR